MPEIDKFFKKLKEMDGSDLHMLAGQPPKFRIHGNLDPLKLPAFDNAQCEKLLFEILSDRHRTVFEEKMDLDFAYEIPGVARFRCNYFRQQHGMGAVFRTIPVKIRTLEDLGVPDTCYRFADLKSGLVLVTGPT